MNPVALYVHVPFCRAICKYCDFARQVRAAADVEVYLRALRIELEKSGRMTPRTMFFGGGTPTSLDANELSQLLDLVVRFVDMKSVVEFTVEANPGTLTPDALTVLRERGVNRISFGVQSFQPRLLDLLGRIHSEAQARTAVADARAAGFTNVSIDLMHGLPTETREELASDIDAALDVAPDHISAYGLSYEDGTPLQECVARGDLKRLGAEEESAHYREAMERLGAAGFNQYEISNYARPGFEAQHNLAYWHNEPYLGVGPAAASYMDGERRVNMRGLREWARALTDGGEAIDSRERLEGEARAREALMLALRLREGADAGEFRSRYDFDFERECSAELQRFSAQGLMERTPTGRWRIARAGLPVADTILSELV